MDDKAEIVAFARESAKAGVDLYDLLGVDGSTSRDDIHRAWRRKGLKYHPDKAGANYDPTLYERFARARDVLVDDEARKVYDTGRAAAAQRRLQSEQMSAERRRFKDELEAAEREHGAAAAAGGAPFGFGGATSTSTAPAASTERDKLREAGRRRAEERQRREQEAQDRVRQREDERIAEIEQRLRDKEDKARRRAERKGGVRDGDSSKPAASDTATAATAQQPPVSQPDAEWRKLLKTGAAQAKAGDVATVQQRPLFAYTMDRLKAAGTAQRRHAARDASATVTPFEPEWEEIDDPEVRKFITRVPKFPAAAAPSARTGHVPMDTAA
ncbi:cell cycle control protein [Sporothrix brasiliensis 5110]|uniref:Cell cycle control protein n=1 Tax=Sporothrix brasiliensis 5110 TaxID=1398154 RepID=A0A0C2ISA9_9PEZI|nr:cell cycle control protein [Sporothrix brasiliensis 5110]KIH91916.1 cell cycle control protein [Sporothrix brasiliensis 5110]